MTADGSRLPLTVTGWSGGGAGYTHGIFTTAGQLTFDAVPAGSTALTIELVTGPGHPSQPVRITIDQPLR